MNHPFKWTDDNFKKAVRLSKTNMTMTEIGRELGTTKNAVLGKLHRQKKKDGYKVSLIGFVHLAKKLICM